MKHGGWDYFNIDKQYSDQLIKRLRDGVEMDSAKGLANCLNQYCEGDLNILDFGSGPGHYYPVLKDKYKGGKFSYTGVDIVEESIKTGQQYFADDSSCHFKMGSVLEPKVVYDNQNCIISANTLPHVPSIKPLLKLITEEKNICYFVFRMLIAGECVQIKKHLHEDNFDNMFEDDFQFNNIYSSHYFNSILGPDWQLHLEEDSFDFDRLDSHRIPEQDKKPFYGNRVSRRVGNMVFKGDVYMPWKYIIGKRVTSI